MDTCTWTRLRTLGRGSTATVSLVKHRHNGDLFAVKSASLARSEILQREQRILSLLHCPRVVAYIGHDVTSVNNLLCYNLHMEYVPGGTLSDAIHRHGGALEESLIRSCTTQILHGLDYLHSNGLAHCDIKGRNILMAPDGAKIADLGCARWVDDDNAPIAGTPLYMAPEVARGEEQGFSGDVWALGCTVIEMATGRPPWSDVDDPVSALHRIAYSVDGPELPSWISDQCKDFLSKCLMRCVKERWTVNQLLQHPFVAESIYDQKPINFEFSPKSTLDQGFWESLEETQMHPDATHVESESDNDDSAVERMRQLMGSSSCPSWRWGSEENWISVRGNDEVDEMSLRTVSVNSSTSEGEVGYCTTSGRLIREESVLGSELGCVWMRVVIALQRITSVIARNCNECDVLRNVGLIYQNYLLQNHRFSAFDLCELHL